MTLAAEQNKAFNPARKFDGRRNFCASPRCAHVRLPVASTHEVLSMQKRVTYNFLIA